ncbi:glutamyl-tRNA reductase [Planctomicrobium piriforme]|uniref:Glutamyl-tRNA reductase n=1 Tax=Planctomicrobium piriforme TaxID=1576369 RepID=A0A1I3GYG6_9PLAN|nr:glutamyl-tRNA reductase [Planctomicrobium piriforme]SFI28479.1 glutamyl-tRNA reductase [Planctomicrobium piriforme]
MNVQVVCCNHQTADLTVREQLAFASPDMLERAYQELRIRFPRSEHVVVSTCNRVELYTAQEDPADAPTHFQLAEFFADFHQLPLESLLNQLLEFQGSEAVQHLFEVASSIDSMVLGESQIVNQIKSAFDAAIKTDANGPLTSALFQRALAVSGRVRTETRLSEGKVSIASVAVGEFGKSIFDRFDDKTVLVVGAGEMATETLVYLQGEGVREILVCNRNLERAQRVASQFSGQAKAWEHLSHCLAVADVIVCTTGAERPVITAEMMRQVRRQSGPRPLFILDLGAPRDVEPAVGNLDDGIFLYDIDDLEATCDRNRKKRVQEIDRARVIIAEETAKFMQDVYHKATGPIVKRLREHWEEISRQELEILFRKLPELDDRERLAIEKSIYRIVNKLLHPPLETLREEARSGPPHGMIDVIKRLFRLRD